MEATKQVSPFVPPVPAVRPSLVTKFAARFSIDPEKLLPILKATAFKQRQSEPEVTNEQMAALLVVADQYGLNPFTREIFAFADKQSGIVPVVGVDGWSRIINDHPQSDGFDFRVAEDMVTPDAGKECPTWMEVVIHRKDRAHPIVVREYLDEVYQPPRGQNRYSGPWQTHTKRMLRHKVMIQGGRLAYGFSGIYDEDEAERIIEGQIIEQGPPLQLTQTGAAGLKQAVVKDRPKGGKKAEAAQAPSTTAPGPGAGGAEPASAKAPDPKKGPTPDEVLTSVLRAATKATKAKDEEIARLALDDAADFARALEGDAKGRAELAINDALMAIKAKFKKA